jgi:phosphoglycolate phosphatase-like HAD superfamily hydrolase
MPGFKPVISGVIVDLDRVAYRGEAPISNAVEAFRRRDRPGSHTPVVVGKPQPRMTEMAQRIGTSQDTTVMTGNQVSTDLLAGQRAGLRSILVTAGLSRDAAATPDRVIDDLLDLIS